MKRHVVLCDNQISCLSLVSYVNHQFANMLIFTKYYELGYVFCAGCDFSPCVSDLPPLAVEYCELLSNGQLAQTHLMNLCTYVAFRYFL